jgi:hypothetical protein
MATNVVQNPGFEDNTSVTESPPWQKSSGLVGFYNNPGLAQSGQKLA